ncbi:hypothetical Protein YC6258_01143 [Gynuella sunshinyii YC6258]|uniref:Uncharacterized protein n=1 Tax=Gynuella sunshinyii YC6258 TaxID=1445510 RepID=A0A0C5VG76_9GAMM|nr:hypothetical Protein YC6258_01143 [Gynuella sunshinyii YC6258]
MAAISLLAASRLLYCDYGVVASDSWCYTRLTHPTVLFFVFG